MRLWSLHPKYLDSKGLVALWREALLAKKVLEGKTKGYKNHPQLIRFKEFKDPLKAINSYLYYVFKEAEKRNYNFNKKKISIKKPLSKIISVTDKQVKYEFQHLYKKLKKRNKNLKIEKIKKIEINPIFYLVKGEIESWEKVIKD